jgi:hypothetical protein
MVATIFPVGADWTRQATESNIGQVVADNALNIIKNRYGKGGTHAGQMNSVGASFQGLPGLAYTGAPLYIPMAERTYQFGNTKPFPASNPASCTYYWTAIARLSPAQVSTISPAYDIYILVFRKGEAGQLFSSPGSGTTELGAPLTPARDSTDLTDSTKFTFNHLLEPLVVTAPYNAGNYDQTLDPPVSGAVPPIGFIGIGATSGTVFRQGVALDLNNASNTKATARPALPAAGESVIFAQPADGTTQSPLIYVYQTTLTF